MLENKDTCSRWLRYVLQYAKSAVVIGKTLPHLSIISLSCVSTSTVSGKVSQQPSSTILVSSERHKHHNSLVAMYSHVKCNTHTRFKFTYQILPCEHNNAHWIWFTLWICMDCTLRRDSCEHAIFMMVIFCINFLIHNCKFFLMISWPCPLQVVY